MNKKTFSLIIFLLLIASFLVGSAIARVKYGGEKQAENLTPTPVVPTQTPFNPVKSDRPEIKFFVMSFCPYGNQAESGIEPVYQLLKDKVTWSPRYIVSKVDQQTIDLCKQSCPQAVFNAEAEEKCRQAIENGQIKDMETCKAYFPYKTADECVQKECLTLKVGTYESLHGDQELNQNVRELVALNFGNLDQWWKFVLLVNGNCTSNNADTCWKAQATAAGLDAAKIESQSRLQNKTLLDKEIEEAKKFQATGSPTVFINGTVYKGGRAPEDYKKAICLAFNNPPSECDTVLGQETAASDGGCE